MVCAWLAKSISTRGFVSGRAAHQPTVRPKWKMPTKAHCRIQKLMKSSIWPQPKFQCMGATGWCGAAVRDLASIPPSLAALPRRYQLLSGREYDFGGFTDMLAAAAFTKQAGTFKSYLFCSIPSKMVFR